MTGLLIRLFIRDRDKPGDAEVRERYGWLAGIVGIVSNLVLFAAKVAIGIFSGSISIIADAVNNLSDCGSSVVTLVGFKLSGIPADEEHPYGHARIEYLSGLAVALLVMVIGVDFFKSSIQKIINPEPVVFSWILVVVLSLSIGIKLWQGMFNRKIGKLINSTTLTATAADSLNDVYTTTGVLLCAIVARYGGWNLDGYVGLAVAVFILVSGIQLVRQTLDPLLGAAPDEKLVKKLQEQILSYPSVLGVHDLMIHSYGPSQSYASVHVEMPASQDILISHDIVDMIERDICAGMGVDLVVHLDPIVTDDPQIIEIQKKVMDIVRELDPVLSIHDFRMVKGPTHSNVIFDITLPPRYKMSNSELRKVIARQIRNLDNRYFCVITCDRSYTVSPGREKA